MAGFNFVMNMRLLQIYRPSALATCALTTPIFGVLASAAITGEPAHADAAPLGPDGGGGHRPGHAAVRGERA